MRRTFLSLVVFLATACGGEPVDLASPSPSAPATPPSPSPPGSSPRPSPSPEPEPTPLTLDLPRGAPTEFAPDLPAREVPPEALVPRGADVEGRLLLAGPGRSVAHIAVVWGRGEDQLRREHGVVVWAHFSQRPAWRGVYAFTDRRRSQVLGIATQTGDLTRDGSEDVLTFEQTGGTGACGTWRVIATAEGTAREIFLRETCDAEIQITAGDLMLTEAVYAPDDPHCCPSATRITTLRWNGRRWRVMERTLVENPPG